MNKALLIIIAVLIFFGLFLPGHFLIRRIFLKEDKYSVKDKFVIGFLSAILQNPYAVFVIEGKPRLPSFVKKRQKVVGGFLLIVANALTYLWLLGSLLLCLYFISLINN